MDSNNQNYQPYQNNQPYQPYQNFQVNSIPEEYRPISMWGYFGYQLLFSIPCIGLILLIVFALGGTKNINLRNFARSYFCYFIIIAIILVILIVSGASLGFLSSLNY